MANISAYALRDDYGMVRLVYDWCVPGSLGLNLTYFNLLTRQAFFHRLLYYFWANRFSSLTPFQQAVLHWLKD